MDHRALLSRIKNAIAILTPVIWLIILPYLFYRKQLSILESYYQWDGFLGLLFLGLIFLILIDGLLTWYLKNQTSIADQIAAFVIETYFSLAFVFLILILAISLDPWLRTPLILRFYEIIGYFWVVIGGVIFFLARHKNPVLFQSRQGIWRLFRHFFSKRIFTIILLIAILLLGFYLRMQNIGNFSPSVDEFPHFKNAIFILEGNLVEYRRAYWTVTMPVAASFKLFGINVYNARVPMVILNLAAMIPLYYFMRGFGRWTGILAVFLYAVNPSIVSMSQLTRDYAPASIFIYWVFFLTADFLRSDLKHGIRSVLFSQKWKLITLFLIFIFAYLDQKSISSVIIANFVAFVFVFAIKMVGEYSKGRKKLGAALGLAVVVISIMLLFAGKFHISEIEVTTKYLEILTTNQFANWSYFFPSISILLIGYMFFEIGRYFFSNKKQKEHVFFYLSFLFFGLLVYTTLFLFTGRLGARARYFVVFVYYLLPIAAIVLIRAFNWLVRNFQTGNIPPTLVITAALFLFCVNFPALKKNSEFSIGYNPITNTPHYDYSAGYEYLEANYVEGEAVVSDQIHKYDYINDRFLQESDVINLKPYTKNEMTFDQLVASHARGWVVKSKNSGLKPPNFQFNDFQLSEYKVEFIGIFNDDLAIWRWEKE